MGLSLVETIQILACIVKIKNQISKPSTLTNCGKRVFSMLANKQWPATVTLWPPSSQRCCKKELTEKRQCDPRVRCRRDVMVLLQEQEIVGNRRAEAIHQDRNVVGEQ